MIITIIFCFGGSGGGREVFRLRSRVKKLRELLQASARADGDTPPDISS